MYVVPPSRDTSAVKSVLIVMLSFSTTCTPMTVFDGAASAAKALLTSVMLAIVVSKSCTSETYMELAEPVCVTRTHAYRYAVEFDDASIVRASELASVADAVAKSVPSLEFEGVLFDA